MKANFTSGILIIALVLTQKSFSQCNNVTSGGTIGSNQSSCTAFDPANIVNVVLPSGGTGTIEYQWQSSPNGTSWTTISGATIQSFDPSTIFSTTYYQRLSRRSGCTTYDGVSNTVIKSVNYPPTPSITAGGPTIFCGPGSVLLTANAAAGITYQWIKDGVNIPGMTSQTYTATQTGNYTVRETVISTGCIATATSLYVASESPLTTTITDAGFTICGASTVQLQTQNAPNYTYQWFEDTHAVPNTNYFSFTTGHDGNYSCTITNSCGSYPSAPYQMMDYQNAGFPSSGTVGASGSTNICNGGSVLLYETQSQFYGWPVFSGYQWYRNGSPIAGATFYQYAATQAGDYVLNLGAYNYCSQTLDYYFTNWITVTLGTGTFPSVSISAGGATSFCPGGNVLLTATATGSNLTYQWQQFGSNIFGATNQSYTASTTGSYNCTVTNACGTASSNNIIVTVLPTTISISLNGNPVICSGASAPLTASGPGPYQWMVAGTNINGATNATYSATVSGTYTCALINACGTFISNGITITVSNSCATGLQFDGTNDYVLAPNNNAYAFGTGNFTIETWIKADPSQTGTQNIIISNRTAGFNGFTLFLNGNSLTFSLNGYSIYYGRDLRDNICHHIALTRINNVISFYLDGVLISGFNSFIADITTSGSIGIGAMPVGGTSNFKGTLMEMRLWNVGRTQTEIQNAMGVSLAGNEPGLVSYWRMNDGSGQIVNDYSITNNDGQMGSTTSVDVNDPAFATACPLSGCSLPVATISAGGNTTFCTGGSVLLSANTGPGISYQWKNSGNNISGATNSTYTASTAGNYTCQLTNSCGNATSNTIIVAVVSSPTAVITAGGPTTFCSGSFVTLSANTGTGLSYQWTVNGSNIALATSSTYNAATGGNYSCSVSNICGAVNSNIISVTVNAVPQVPGTITGTTTICAGNPGVAYSVSAVSGATSYLWTAPAGATIASGQSTNAVTIDFSSSAVSGNICVSAVNSCGTSNPRCVALTVSSVPIITNQISGSSFACANTTGNVYSISGVTGATSFTWTIPQGATFVSGQGTSSITLSFGPNGANGNICVYAGNACGTNSTCKSVTAVTGVTPPAGISGTAFPCANSSGIFYSCTPVTNASSYQWTVPATATITSGQGTTGITVDFNSSFTTGAISVSAVNCAGTSTPVTLQVFGTPLQPGTISGPAIGVCGGAANVQYSVAALPGAASYTWTAPSNATITSGQGTTTIRVNFGNGFSGGTLSVRVTNSCGTGAARTLSISTVPPMPGTINGPATFCANSNVIYSIAAVNGATTYNWDVPTGASITSGQGTTSITVHHGTHSGKIKVRAGNGCGYSAYQILNVTKTCREGGEAIEDVSVLEVQVFPNPSSTQFSITVHNASADYYNFILRDITGRIMEEKDHLSIGQVMDFGSGLSNGIYFAEIQAGDERKIVRIIKQE